VRREHAAFLVLWLCACHGTPLPDDLKRAQAHEAAHQLDDAIAGYRAIWSECERTHQHRTKDDCAIAAIREAELEEQEARFPAAYASWRKAAALSDVPRTMARSLVRAAQLSAERLHDLDGARTLAWYVVEHFADEIPADDALALGIRLERDVDPAALGRRLEALWRRFDKLDLGDNLLFARAQLVDQTSTDWRAAVALYDQVAATYPRSGLWDDSLWRAAQLLREHGDPEGAIRRLDQIIDARKDALITGSYNSLYVDDAMLLKGQIALDDLHDAKRAREAFHTLVDGYKESVLRDDALAELARAALSTGDHAGACAALDRILNEFPNGNRFQAAVRQEAELRCHP
jgi:tetratricopeptide (TPR) repeat protein